MVKLSRGLGFVLLVCFVLFTSPVVVFASSLDDLGSSDSQQVEDDTGGSGAGNSITDYLKGYDPVTADNMEQASQLASPIASAIGTLSGFLVIVVEAAIFLITALDLVYIGVPPLRSVLNPSYGQASGGAGGMGGMGMGGMGMGGMGMRGMGMGGMGMGMPGGTQSQQGLGLRFVSDEAIQCVQLAEAGNAPQGGMMGGMGMGGMMGGQQATPSPSRKSVALEYLKKRSFFLIIFTVCLVVLMSSVFTDCGINLAELLMRVMQKLNGSINSVDI